MIPKIELRTSFEILRTSLCSARRAQASERICNQIKGSCTSLILSFEPFRSEIDLSELNRQLGSEKRLVLPKVNQGNLNLYLVDDLLHQLEISSLGLREPVPDKCKRISPLSVDLVLVPGLAFDNDHYRLGYGKGHYDRLLTENIPSIGVGFREQKSAHLLPRDPWDIPVGKLLLA